MYLHFYPSSFHWFFFLFYLVIRATDRTVSFFILYRLFVVTPFLSLIFSSSVFYLSFLFSCLVLMFVFPVTFPLFFLYLMFCFSFFTWPIIFFYFLLFPSLYYVSFSEMFHSCSSFRLNTLLFSFLPSYSAKSRKIQRLDVFWLTIFFLFFFSFPSKFYVYINFRIMFFVV